MFGHTYFGSYFGAGYFGPSAGVPLVSVSFAASIPTLGAPLLKQKHVFVATAFAGSPPILSAAGLINVLVPVGKMVGAPTIGQPKLTKTLTAEAIATTPLVIPIGALQQKHIVVPIGFVVAAPALSVPPFGAGRLLTATSLAASAPTLAITTLHQKHFFTAVGHTVSAPVLEVSGRPISTHALIANGFIGSAPVTGAPIIRLLSILHAADLMVSGPDFGAAPEAEETGPPVVWLRNRLKHWSNDPDDEYWDEDGTENEGPLQEAIFSNLNDEIELTISHLTLAGRTSPERGPAEAILPQQPLYLFDRKLQVDWTDVEQLQTDLTAETDARIVADGALAGAILQLRQVVTTPTTFYVSTTGSNSNDGSAATPWQTVAYAAQRISDLDARAAITVQLADGTYNETPNFLPAIGGHGATITFVGNATTPANVVLRGVGFYQGSVLPYYFAGIRFAPMAAGVVINVNDTNVYLDNCEFAATVGAYSQIRAGNNSTVALYSANKIIGGGAHHLIAVQGGKIYYFPGTVTITGTPAFSAAFAWTDEAGMILSSGVTFSGAATGKKYRAQVSGLINTYGSGINYFPGDVAGDVVTGGQYL